MMGTLNLMTGSLYGQMKAQRYPDTDRRRPGHNRGRDWGHVSTSQAVPGVAGRRPSSSSPSSEGTIPAHSLISGLWAPES